jgi:hypothetical protein
MQVGLPIQDASLFPRQANESEERASHYPFEAYGGGWEDLR